MICLFVSVSVVDEEEEGKMRIEQKGCIITFVCYQKDCFADFKLLLLLDHCEQQVRRMIVMIEGE